MLRNSGRFLGDVVADSDMLGFLYFLSNRLVTKAAQSQILLQCNMNLDLGQVWSGFILGNWIQKGLIFGALGVCVWRLGIELALDLHTVQIFQHVFGALTDRLAFFWRDALQVFDHQGRSRVAGKAGFMLV